MAIIKGDNLPNTLTGTNADDVIYGFGGNDQLSGLDGDDLLIGGLGADVINGGAGYDLASYFSSTAGVTVSLASGVGSGGEAQGDTLLSIEDLEGSNFNDRLTGNAGSNYLIGLSGNDSLNGAAGDDVLFGGSGADAINGGAGYDLAGYIDSTVGVTVSLATGVGSGGEAQGDKLLSIEALGGSNFKDSLIGNAGSNYLFGISGNDSLNGAAGDDYLFGGSGADVIDGGAGYDLASYFYSTAGVTVSLTSGAGSGGEAQGDRLLGIEDLDGSNFNDRLTGNAGSNYLFGNSGNDLLNGASGNDWIYGGAGNDTLIGGLGADTMRGETGADTYYVDSAGDVVIELAGAGIDRIVSSISTSLSVGAKVNVENLTLTGSAIGGTGNALGNIIIGNSLNNVLSGLAGNDSLIGGLGNDTLIGGLGNDFLNGGGGADNMRGDTGNDNYVVDSAGDVVTEFAGAGIDKIVGSISVSLSVGAKVNVENLTLTGSAISGTGNALANVITGNSLNNVLSGLAGNDTLIGGLGNDRLIGGLGNDIINGGGGADNMRGDTGDDTYVVDNAGDVVSELAGAGIDRIVSSISTSMNFGGRLQVENLTLTGSAISGVGNALGNAIIGNGLNNALSGLAGDDSLDGAAGNDTLSGGDGNDLLNGGSGADTIATGGGSDIVLFNALLGSGVDQVSDFSTAFDTIHLEDAIFVGLAQGAFLPAGALLIGAAAADADDRIIYNDATGALSFDPDGTGAAAQIQFALFNVGLAMTEADFFVV